MSLSKEIESVGSWLFRHRSIAPVAIFPLFVATTFDFSYVRHSHELTEYWQVGCMAVALLGLVIRIVTVGHAPPGTSGRNTCGQIARTLNTTGMYSMMRHPLYFGNYLIFMGFVLFFHSWWLLLLATSLFALYYERIMVAEEAFLHTRFGVEFETWASRTPAFIPKLTAWVPSTLPLCWRTVLRREYTAFLQITAVFALLDLVGDSFVERQLTIDWRWMVVLAVGMSVYLALRTLKKTTRLLHVEGR